MIHGRTHCTGASRRKNLLTRARRQQRLCNVLMKRIVALLLVAAFGLSFSSRASAADDEQRGRAAQQNAAPSGWDLAVTGGFVVTGLIDPVYALGSVSGQPTRVVVRTTNQESSANLGVAMFGQVYHDRYAWIAPLSFGIGIRGDSRATLYIGSALRFGSHASFTAGVAIGPVATLPAGVVEGRTIAETNLLSNLPTRTTHSWFGGVTYTFASLR